MMVNTTIKTRNDCPGTKNIILQFQISKRITHIQFDKRQIEKDKWQLISTQTMNFSTHKL